MPVHQRDAEIAMPRRVLVSFIIWYVIFPMDGATRNFLFDLTMCTSNTSEPMFFILWVNDQAKSKQETPNRILYQKN